MSCDDHTVLAMYPADITDAAMKSLHCDLLGRPQCRSTSRTRGSHGRRGNPTLFRESSRGGSRGAPGAKSRSRSGACHRMPSREVQLRVPKDEPAAPEEPVTTDCGEPEMTATVNPDKKAVLEEKADHQPRETVGQVNDCASGFVLDLLDDAVNDFADDLVHDVDDSYPVQPNDQAPTALTVGYAVEPMITECEEEEDDTWAAATIITEVAAKQALQNNEEKESTQDTESTQDSGKADDYEEVYSLASGEPQDEEIDEEIEAMAFTKMAMTMAKDAVDKAAVQEQQEVIHEDVQSKSDVAFDFVCNVLDGAISGASETAWQAADGAEGAVDEPPTASVIEDARLKARDILLKTAMSGELETKLMSMKKQEQAPVDIETLRREAKQTMLKAARSGALEQIMKKNQEKPATFDSFSMKPSVMTWNTHKSNGTAHSLRMAARETLLKGAASGKLEEFMNKLAEQKKKQQHTDESDAQLRTLARDTLFQAVRTGKLQQILQAKKEQKREPEKDDVDELRHKAKDQLFKAFRNGNFEEMMKKRMEEKQAAEVKACTGCVKGCTGCVKDMHELRMKARESLVKAAKNGSLEERLAKKVKDTEAQKEDKVNWTKDTLKQQLRRTLGQAAKNGQLPKILSKVRRSPQEAAEVSECTGCEKGCASCVKECTGCEKGCASCVKECAGCEKGCAGCLKDEPKANVKSLESLRLAARNTFVKAAEGNKLDEAVEFAIKAREARETNDLRLEARNTLLKAVRNGRLEQSLQKAKDAKKAREAAETEELRLEARNTLLKAVQSGHLEQSIQKAKDAKKARNIAGLKTLAIDTLFKAAASGHLEQAFQKVKAKKQTEEVAEVSKCTGCVEGCADCVKECTGCEKGCAGCKKDSLKELKQAARDTLLKGTANGKLAEAFERVRKAKVEKVDSLRLRLRQTFTKAAQGNALQNALMKVKAKKAKQAEEATELKACAQATLLEGAASGHLEQILTKMREERQTKKADHMAALKLKAREALSKAVHSGVLDQKLEGMKEKKKADNMEALKLKAREALSKALHSGVLDHKLEGMKEEKKADNMEALKLKAREALSKAMQSGALDQKLVSMKEKKVAHIEELKFKAREALLKVARNGDFEKAMEKAKQARQEREAEELRLQAQDSLFEAVADGRLTQVLDKISKARQVEDLREKAHTTLMEGFKNGKLEEFLKTRNARMQNESTEDIRLLARDTLFKAVNQDTLASAIEKVKEGRKLRELSAKAEETFEEAEAEESDADDEEEEEEELKAIARDALLKASENGGFERAMLQIQRVRQQKQEQTDLEELRTFARNTLTQAYSTGGLEEAFEMISRKREEEEERQEARDLKMRVRSKLMEATRSGHLNDAFKKVFAENEVESLRMQARDTIQKAAQNGALQKAIAKVAKAREERSHPAVTLEEQTFKIKLPATPKTFSMVQEPELFQLTPPASPPVQARTPKLQSLQDMESGASTRESTPTARSSLQHSKSKRRIIGGVVRQPSSTRLERLEAPMTPSRSERRTKKEQDKQEKPSSSTAPKLLLQHPRLSTEVDWSTCVKAFGAPAFDRPPSKTSARLRKAVSMSALAMDLGSDAAPSAPPMPNPFYGSPDMTSTSSPSFSNAFAPISFTTSSLDKKRSSSLGSLKAPKKASGLLPSLPGSTASTESIAWSMEMSKASKWSPTVDWRGSGAIF